MVKLVNLENVEFLKKLVYSIFHAQEKYTHIVEVNHPNVKPCLYALWHCNQLSVYGIQNKSELNILVSRSKDGEIVAYSAEQMGFKAIRGSKGKQGAVEASMNIISALNAGENCAMMVDGPKGPPKKVKDGIIKLAKMAGAPIVPMMWYSINPTFVSFPSWDKLRMPIYHTNIINLYGEPIYVKEEDDIEEARKLLQEKLEELDIKAAEAYKEVYLWGMWKRRRKDDCKYNWT